MEAPVINDDFKRNTYINEDYMKTTRYELRINGGLVAKVGRELALKVLDEYNQCAHDNPEDLVQLVKIEEEVVRTNIDV